MEAIHQFKYAPKGYLGDILGPLLAEFAGQRFSAERLLVVPVPLHPRRLRERGFNQSLALARHVAKRLKADLDYLSLRRMKYTVPQTGLGKEERQKNVRGAFRLKDNKSVKGRAVLLVDDVATTGSTLNECAGVLRKAGCEKVFCLALAMTAMRQER
jgi:ComF family protein